MEPPSSQIEIKQCCFRGSHTFKTLPLRSHFIYLFFSGYAAFPLFFHPFSPFSLQEPQTTVIHNPVDGAKVHPPFPHPSSVPPAPRPVPSRPVLTWFSLWVVDLVTSLACAVGLMSVCLVVYPSASCCMRTQEPFPGLTLPPLCSEGWSSGEGGGEVTLSPPHTHRSHTHPPPPSSPHQHGGGSVLQIVPVWR